MSEDEARNALDSELCKHIFGASASMVGVCLTVIGLLRIVITMRKADTFADDLVALNAFLFLISCLSSYWALRSHSASRLHRVEKFADLVFTLAMCLTVFICAFITYAIAET